jgi:hypothetical protein
MKTLLQIRLARSGSPRTTPVTLIALAETMLRLFGPIEQWLNLTLFPNKSDLDYPLGCRLGRVGP